MAKPQKIPMKIIERHRLDDFTFGRITDCADRKATTVAALIRMAFSYCGRQTAPDLTYDAGRKPHIVSITDLLIPVNHDEICSVVNFYLDKKDNGERNDDRGMDLPSISEGIYTAVVLGDTIDSIGYIHAVSSIAMNQYVYTFCSPAEPMNEWVNCRDVAPQLSQTAITCPTCAFMLQAARNFPITQSMNPITAED